MWGVLLTSEKTSCPNNKEKLGNLQHHDYSWAPKKAKIAKQYEIITITRGIFPHTRNKLI